MQSELIAARTAADSAVWYHALMGEFPFLFGFESKVPPIPLLIDNQACLSVANHPENSQRTKHIALREFRIRDYVEGGQVRPLWCPGTHNLADHFTKILQKLIFSRLNISMGIVGLGFSESMPPLQAPKSKPTLSMDGLCIEHFSIDGQSSKYHSFLPFDNSRSIASYNAFCNSGGVTIPIEFSGMDYSLICSVSSEHYS